MNVASVVKSFGRKRVVVEGLSSEPDAEVKDFALKAAGENRSSIFGSNIHREGDRAYFTFYTD